jgi:hypothetical protein
MFHTASRLFEECSRDHYAVCAPSKGSHSQCSGSFSAMGLLPIARCWLPAGRDRLCCLWVLVLCEEHCLWLSCPESSRFDCYLLSGRYQFKCAWASISRQTSPRWPSGFSRVILEKSLFHLRDKSSCFQRRGSVSSTKMPATFETHEAGL